MKPAPDRQTCATCRCWVGQAGDEAGQCKRYPPVVVVVDELPISVFPMTVRDDSCGEFAVRCHS